MNWARQQKQAHYFAFTINVVPNQYLAVYFRFEIVVYILLSCLRLVFVHFEPNKCDAYVNE